MNIRSFTNDTNNTGSTDNTGSTRQSRTGLSSRQELVSGMHGSQSGSGLQAEQQAGSSPEGGHGRVVLWSQRHRPQHPDWHHQGSVVPERDQGHCGGQLPVGDEGEEHAWCAFWCAWCHPARWCCTPRRQAGHSDCQEMPVCLHAHCSAQADGAHLPSGNPVSGAGGRWHLWCAEQEAWPRVWEDTRGWHPHVCGQGLPACQQVLDPFRLLSCGT